MGVTAALYPGLLGSSVDHEMEHLVDAEAIEHLQTCWRKRRAAALTDHHYLALFLDPRSTQRTFVASSALAGTASSNTLGNTPALQRARAALKQLAPIVVTDADVPAQHAGKDSAKVHLLVKQLDLFLEVRTGEGMSKLAMDKELLDTVQASDPPVQFWQSHAPAQLALRRAAQRVFCAKAAAAAVERVWSVFGRVWVPHRRSMTSKRVALLVYVCMNMHLLDDGPTLQRLGITPSSVKAQSFVVIFEAVAAMDDVDELSAAQQSSSLVESTAVPLSLHEPAPKSPELAEPADLFADFDG
jgi:hypothetical protein